MRRSSASAALLLTAVLALAGCSTSGSAPSDDGTSQDAAVAPASGETITGDGYSYSVPDGWGEPDPSMVPAGLDSVAVDLTDSDGFADNVNVVLSPAGEVTADQVESAGVQELEGAGATEVSAQERVQVAGSESAHLSATMSASGVDYLIEQYYLTADGQTYVVTFSFSDTVPAGDRTDLAESVLASWTWS